MRFSLKWVLVGMAYCAVAAAAFSQQTWMYADVLWAATLVAFALAVLVACFARGPRQVSAAGFVVFAGCFLLCVHFSSHSVPIERLLVAAGVGADSGNNIMNPPQSPFIRRQVVRSVDATAGRVVTSEYVVTPPALPTPVATPAPASPYAAAPVLAAPVAPAVYAPIVISRPADLTMYIRAGNAVATMAFGLLGCMLGSLALRAKKSPSLEGRG